MLKPTLPRSVAAITRLLAVLSLAGTTLLAHAADPVVVQRKSGLWETRTTVMGLSSTVRQCVVKENDDLPGKLAARGSADCPEQNVQRNGNEIALKAVCQANGREIRTSGTITGDFESSYQGKLTVEVSPAVNGISSSQIELSAKWTGPCDDTASGTTVDLPGQQRMDLNDPKLREMIRNLRQQMGK